jgi:hypothetical protein
MNRPSWKYSFSALAASSFLLAAADRASAAVTFSASGGDLVVTIDAPIHFLVTSATTSTQFALNFEDVYSTGNSDHHGDVPTSGTSTLTLPGGIVSDGLDTWSDLGTTLGVLDPTDFYATYYFNNAQLLQVGQVVTVGTGAIIVEGFISRGGLVPDQAVTSIHLIDESLSDLSSPMVVPEPKAVLLGGLGLLALLMRRR